MNLLIVDSHMESGEIYKTLAKEIQEKLNLEAVDEGKLAIKYLRHKDVDALVIRYLLPDMKGSKLASIIHNKKPNIPIFVAVEDPGIDVWQEITAAKGLVLPMPIDIKRILQICAGNRNKNEIKTKIETEDIKTSQNANKNNNNPDPDLHKQREQQKIFIPEKSKNKSRLKKQEHQCQIITIFSPKGGVGKTTTVVNLAALTQTELGMRTAILEFTRQTGNVLGHFDLNPSIDVSHWISREEWPDEDELEDMLLWCPNTETAILPTQRLYDEDTKKTKILPEHVVGIINTLRPHFDCMIIDGGTIIDDVLFQLMALSDYVGMVSIQNLETLQDCHYVPMMMERRGINTDKLVNILNQAKKHVGMTTKDAFAIVGTEKNHVIHYDKEVEKVPKEKEPFIIRKNNKGKYYTEIKELAAMLVDNPKFHESKGILNKLTFWKKE